MARVLTRPAMMRRVTFDDALSVLLALVGQRVDNRDRVTRRGLLAHFSGVLAAGHELAAREDAAPVFFSFDDGGSGFVVSPATFATATRIATRRRCANRTIGVGLGRPLLRPGPSA